MLHTGTMESDAKTKEPDADLNVRGYEKYFSNAAGWSIAVSLALALVALNYTLVTFLTPEQVLVIFPIGSIVSFVALIVTVSGFLVANRVEVKVRERENRTQSLVIKDLHDLRDQQEACVKALMFLVDRAGARPQSWRLPLTDIQEKQILVEKLKSVSRPKKMVG